MVVVVSWRCVVGAGRLLALMTLSVWMEENSVWKDLARHSVMTMLIAPAQRFACWDIARRLVRLTLIVPRIRCARMGIVGQLVV